MELLRCGIIVDKLPSLNIISVRERKNFGVLIPGQTTDRKKSVKIPIDSDPTLSFVPYRPSPKKVDKRFLFDL